MHKVGVGRYLGDRYTYLTKTHIWFLAQQVSLLELLPQQDIAEDTGANDCWKCPQGPLSLLWEPYPK